MNLKKNSKAEQNHNGLFKDLVLDKLADTTNVAQFVSFSPKLEQRYARIYGFPPNCAFDSVVESVSALLAASPESSVNIRSFLPDQPQSHEFIYGLKSVEEVVQNLHRISSEGLYTIVNETVDVDDGGVSGVLQGGQVEFAPGVVPRFVEKSSAEAVSSIPLDVTVQMLRTVYGFEPEIAHYKYNMRVEFSIHPKRRGWKRSHTIIWEEEEFSSHAIEPFFVWPTSFSKFIGDKAYGLLVAHCLGFPVPRTTVFARNELLGIFTFGVRTDSSEIWMRTCPSEQVPGHFITARGWQDPYVLMEKDDPEGDKISSCLAQQEIPAQYSGAMLTTSEGAILEGVKGFGDLFMLGKVAPSELPQRIKDDLKQLHRQLVETFGPVRFEWVHDGQSPWIVQLHTGVVQSSERVIFPGDFDCVLDFNVEEGLETLRGLVKEAKETNCSILVHGNIGMSSHIADVLRKSEVASRIVSK